MDFHSLAERALRDELPSREEARAVLCAPDSQLDEILVAARRVREAHFGRRVKLCLLLNAQSGICPEDCGYCSQSKVSTAPVQKYKLLPHENIVARAKTAVEAGATRFCMAVAARSASERDVAHLGAAVREIKSDPATCHLEICTSLGLVNAQKCRDLKAAGVDYVNHNLNTSENHYPSICSTHTYADRVETLGNIKDAGLHTCAGGIIGMGESLDDLLDMGFALRELEIESIPINILLRISGVPLEEKLQGVPETGVSHALKVMCLMRFLNPRAEVRAAAGRERLEEHQAKVLWPANSLFVDGYLTTPGEHHTDVRRWIENAGFEIEA
ncbi:MAG: biotin synthase BioB [Armatimonadetes bacterium]|nr:biotin synthase BioB [Armatimonadota bacterium]